MIEGVMRAFLGRHYAETRSQKDAVKMSVREIKQDFQVFLRDALVILEGYKKELGTYYEFKNKDRLDEAKRLVDEKIRLINSFIIVIARMPDWRRGLPRAAAAPQ